MQTSLTTLAIFSNLKLSVSLIFREEYSETSCALFAAYLLSKGSFLVNLEITEEQRQKRAICQGLIFITGLFLPKVSAIKKKSSLYALFSETKIKL